MEMNEVVNFLRFPMSQLNQRFDEGEKQLDDFMEEALEWCNKMKLQLKLQNKFTQPTLENLPGRKRRAKQNSAVTQSTLNSDEGRFSHFEESVAGRTRRAIKAMQHSEGTSLNPVLNITNEIPAQRRTTRKTNASNAVTNKTRSAEELPKNHNAKKRKSLTSKDGESSDSSQIFVKPKIKRGRKAKTEKPPVKALENSTLEESQFFNSPILHTSSPKATPSVPSGVNNSKVNSPKGSVSAPKPSSPRVSARKSSNKETGDPSPVSSSSDFIGDSREENDGGETRGGRRSLRESIRNSESKGSVTNSPKLNSSKNAESTLINNSVIDKTKTPSPVSTTPKNREDTHWKTTVNAENSNMNNTTKTNTPKIRGEDDGNGNNGNVTVTMGEGQVGGVNEGESEPKEPKEMRVTRFRSKTSLGNNSPDVKPEIPVMENLNVTKTIVQPLKRTKPVVKPQVLDNDGGLVQVKVEVDSIGNEMAERTYLLRSSTGSNSNRVDTVVPAEKSAERAEEKRPVGRTKRTKAVKQERNEIVADESAQTGRITRTKSKKAKEAAAAAAAIAAAAVVSSTPNGKISGLTILARKSLNKAKIIAIQQEKKKNLQALSLRPVNQPVNKIAVVSKLNTPKNRENFPGMPYLKSTENIIHSGKGKYLHLYNERTNALLTSGNKRNAAGELLAKSAKENEIERELKLRALREKEEEAKFKRDMVIQNRQKELKEKNEMKLLSATKMRQKIEMEKHINIVQSEKEKEAKRKLLLEKRELRLKEKAEKKKMMLNQKLAETEERRRLEEEARIAKIKEQEAEQRRIKMDKEKEIERHQKWAQERAADEQAREKYEMKIKEQQMKLKMMSSKKPDKPETSTNYSKYKPKNENDFGLEEEHSEVDSSGEEPAPSRSPIAWAKKVLEKKCPCAPFIPQDIIREYMACHSKTPDIQKMFKMTPRKRIQRTSSAIWNTPSS